MLYTNMIVLQSVVNEETFEVLHNALMVTTTQLNLGRACKRSGNNFPLIAQLVGGVAQWLNIGCRFLVGGLIYA